MTDPTDPTESGGANQPHADDPDVVPPSQPAADTTSAPSGTPDDPTAGAGGGERTGEPQVGAPEGTVPDEPAALGTTETAQPIQGVHTPDVGPGGDDQDTDANPTPGRAGGAT